MRYYLDAEYTCFGGELMSLALVPADPALESFYVAVEWAGPTDPWVETHVVPHLGSDFVSRELASLKLATFMRERAVGHMVIVADWPTDFEHLLALLITGPGRMQPVPDFDMKFQRLPGFNTASTSRMPHNALADAEALRDHCEANHG
ncbi:hypothetical protein [Myxococcus virescens]|uniref:Uncharacterized protein n=2 Tax=Myxococcus virescens TaxID=83456 RepID=A0A511HM35_9BACT|nr:hypothetical protein [Myxococcus virescens]GEL74640.1 hypothetical protein MVI01_64240 [Myxococcus virescens]SDE54851.1 hypothetical protein SAMN04488504_108168 [Myxococcus virescens]